MWQGSRDRVCLKADPRAGAVGPGFRLCRRFSNRRVEVKLFSSFSEMTQDDRVVRSRPIADLLSHQIITRARCVGSKASLRVGDAFHWVFNAGSRETLNTGSRYAAVQTLGE